MRLLTICLLLVSALAAADVKYDGSRVHCESYGNGKDAIVFIPGWTYDLTFWRGQAPVYNKHRALLVDPDAGVAPEPKLLLHMAGGKVVEPCDLRAIPEWAKPILATAMRRRT